MCVIYLFLIFVINDDNFMCKLFQRLALQEISHEGAKNFRVTAKKLLTPAQKAPVKKARAPKRLIYHLTGEENEIQQRAHFAMRKKDPTPADKINWICHNCMLRYPDDKGKVPWASCIACPNRVHTKCVAQKHRTGQKLAKKEKLKTEDFEYTCEDCCQKKCCS